MTEKEVEMAYKKMAESDAPDLWWHHTGNSTTHWARAWLPV